MEKGLEVRQADTTGTATNDFLISLMSKLETDKAALPSTPSKEEGRQIVLDFALTIFNAGYVSFLMSFFKHWCCCCVTQPMTLLANSDEECRSGFGDKNTARKFYAASNFLEIIRQFGDLGEDIEVSS